MERIETDLREHQDPAKLKLFLQSCREEAIEDGHYKIASITLPVSFLDPLAVLDSIYEERADHFYMENPSKGFAIAGAEAVVNRTVSGAGRFQEIIAFQNEVLEHTVAIGDLSLPFSGPHFFCGFAFEVEGSSKDSFPSGSCFLPHWQVAKVNNQTVAVANFRVDPDGELDGIVERIWRAYQKFSSFDYSEAAKSERPKIVTKKPIPGEAVYQQSVKTALGMIEKGDFEKIVLSRAYDLEFDRHCEPLKILNQLRSPYQNCYLFSYQNDDGISYIGASPERLLRLSNGLLETEAIAGSEPRGNTSIEDAQLGSGLLKSDKDLREHRHVIKSIEKRLKSIGIEGGELPDVELMHLPNVMHLRTKIEIPLKKSFHLLEIAEVLHPTPAVGGTPREKVLSVISKLEVYSRNLYTGTMGWVDSNGDGEFIVGLRTALIRGKWARLFAGAGIVEGSNPEKETKETEHKMRALLDVMTKQF